MTVVISSGAALPAPFSSLKVLALTGLLAGPRRGPELGYGSSGPSYGSIAAHRIGCGSD